MAYRSHRVFALGCTALASLSGCGGAAGKNADAGAQEASVEQQDVTLVFGASVGGEPFSCTSSYDKIGLEQRTVSFEDLRFYVYDVALIDDAGKHYPVTLQDDGAFQVQNIAMLDFEDMSGTCSNGTAETNTSLHGKVEVASYAGVSFRIGLPPEINHANLAQQKPPLTVTQLWWSWLDGHKFMRVDLRVAADGSDKQHEVNAHLGAIGCTGKQGAYVCSREDSPTIELSNFDVDADTIVLDLAKLVAGMTLASRESAANPVGCLSDSEDHDCEPYFEALGLDFATGNAGSQPQTVFSVETR